MIVVDDSGQPLGPKPVNDTLESRFDTNKDKPSAYVSPYDTGNGGNGGGTATVTF
jgi:hypothetical protein